MGDHLAKELIKLGIVMVVAGMLVGGALTYLFTMVL
jgi:hypothetical protein